MSALPITISVNQSGWTLQAWDQSFAFKRCCNKKNSEQLVDCCSLNLSCQAVEQGVYFSPEDIRNLLLAYQKKIAGKKVIMLDISSAQGYLTGTISEKEQQVMAFLSNPFSKEFYRLFKAPSMHTVTDLFDKEGSFAIIVLEGSLKQDLLLHGGFSADEKQLLQEDKRLLCQIAEIFSYAMGLGYEARSGSGHLFSSTSYFRCTDDTPFTPCSRICTIYPPLYEKIYHLHGHVPSELAKVFSVTGEGTTLCVEEKTC